MSYVKASFYWINVYPFDLLYFPSSLPAFSTLQFSIINQELCWLGGSHLMVDYYILFSSVRLWALTGQVLMEMVGHTSIVYSVDSHVSGHIASGSEDCSTKIWKGRFTLSYCGSLHKAILYFWK